MPGLDPAAPEMGNNDTNNGWLVCQDAKNVQPVQGNGFPGPLRLALCTFRGAEVLLELEPDNTFETFFASVAAQAGLQLVESVGSDLSVWTQHMQILCSQSASPCHGDRNVLLTGPIIPKTSHLTNQMRPCLATVEEGASQDNTASHKPNTHKGATDEGGGKIQDNNQDKAAGASEQVGKKVPFICYYAIATLLSCQDALLKIKNPSLGQQVHVFHIHLSTHAHAHTYTPVLGHTCSRSSLFRSSFAIRINLA